MPTITVETSVVESPRVAQLRGLFDLPAEATSRLSWDVRLPLDEQPWNVGLITGPSGCGKSTIARALWPGETAHAATLSWERDRSVVDGFPAGLSIKEVAGLLSAVGFSSPPAWLRPFAVLSTGQQFRVGLARLLAEALAGQWPLIVCDEFTSVVDRTVAQIGSAALARAVRARRLRFVAVTCHDDVLDWLQPDWVYRPAEGRFEWRCLRRRPAIELRVARCGADLWPLFSHHHYLSHSLCPASVCFAAWWRGRPVAFSAWLPFVGTGRPARREHRTVTLPDYQGVGIGHALSGLVASLWRGLGWRALSTTTHPAMIAARLRSPCWVLRRAPALAAGRGDRLKHATTRLTAGFEYTGPALARRLARRLLRG
jgi:ABC-type polar amino acid transport system ATPase subunit